MTQAILYPVLVMILLTAVVLLRLGYGRVRYLQTQRIHPQKVANRKGASEVFAPLGSLADHFQNLLEVPVLFYVLVAFLLIVGKVDTSYLALAWLFVAGRAAHTLIHCTYNKVRHRFVAFLLSTLVLLIMWARFALQVLMG
ncbi:hypothetical protein HPT27_14815 [Permianibacter sp. IMCC34836]|uniref:MAPEG family protein n=1 Tax=Permianibacter fluminis TaxID=2738515 RepID=UPI00155444EA|nr:MAPEG family protein [Permianibacter fluminis]NQD38297.1 hypothetical protein [Permianibacter fluminis]